MGLLDIINSQLMNIGNSLKARYSRIDEFLTTKNHTGYMFYDPQHDYFMRLMCVQYGDNGMFGPISYKIHYQLYFYEELPMYLGANEIARRFIVDIDHLKHMRKRIIEIDPDNIRSHYAHLTWIPFDIVTKYGRVQYVTPRFTDAKSLF